MKIDFSLHKYMLFQKKTLQNYSRVAFMQYRYNALMMFHKLLEHINFLLVHKSPIIVS